MISDMKMPEMSGMELMIKTRKMYPELPIIFLTAYGSIPDAVNAVKAGAVDYLAKPFDGRDLILKAYQEAIRLEYRFFSFGDAMLLI